MRARAAMTERRASDWAIITLLSTIGVLAALQGTLLVPLVSLLPEIYDVDPVAATWIITVTLLAGAVATPIVSRLADMHGKRRLLLCALAVMVLGSVLLATTDDFALAVAGRAMQGFSGSLIPVSMSILKDVLPAERVGPGVALVSGTMGVGAAVGLPLAGVMYAQLGWSSLFWMTAVLACLMMVAAWRVLPPMPAGSRDRFDFPGAILLMIGLTPLLLVMAQGNQWGWSSPVVWQLLLASAVAFALWGPWELRRAAPLVDLRMASRRGVVMTNVAAFAVAIGMLANLIVASYQLATPATVDGGFGLSASTTGLLMAAPAGVLVVASPVIGRLLKRFGGQPLLQGGSLVMALAYVSRVYLDEAVWQVVLSSVFVGIGTSLAFASMPMIIMSSVPRSLAASANGVNSLFRMMGTAASNAAIAALTAATSVVVLGRAYPSEETFHLTFWGCAAATLVAATLAGFVPRGQAAKAREEVPGDGAVVVGQTLPDGSAAPALRTSDALVIAGRHRYDRRSNHLLRPRTHLQDPHRKEAR